MFFDQKLSKTSQFYYLEAGLNLPLRTFLKPRSLSFKKDTITAETVSQLKCPEGRKKFRFTLLKQFMVLHSLVRTWDTFLEVMLAMNLE